MRPVDTVQGAGVTTRLPNRRRLAAGIAEALGETKVDIVAREPNVYTSTFPTETVTCRLKGSDTIRLFCKYGPTVYESGYGHRGGVAYEAAVYRDVLRRAGVTVPQFVGEYTEGGVTWLFIEPIEPSARVSKVPLEDGLVKAAGWLARLHARFEGESLDGLRVHDSRYYVAWAQRTLCLAETYSRRLAWLRPLCKGYEELVPRFAGRPGALIHGEFTASNILASQGTIYPVDWQSAALGAGEEDLAALTDHWGRESTQLVTQTYAAVRWPHGAPTSFEQMFLVARIYYELRWLGDPIFRKRNPVSRLDSLRTTGEQLALI